MLFTTWFISDAIEDQTYGHAILIEGSIPCTTLDGKKREQRTWVRPWDILKSQGYAPYPDMPDQLQTKGQEGSKRSALIA